MANPVIYNWFKEQIPAKTEVPFQETQGMLVTQTGLPEMWCTMEFDAGGRQRLTVGGRYISREYGTCTAVFLCKAGRGPDAVQRVAQLFADAMDGEHGASLVEASGVEGTLRIDNVSPPNGEPYEDGNWLVCSVSCVYTYDSVRGAVA
jgi:hypothetical protein